MQKDLKTQTDDDFEKLLDDFINGKYDDALEAELPFPKEMDDRVARIKLGDNQEKHKCMDDIASVDLKLMSDTDHYSDAAMRVILKGKPGASLRPHRFSCYFYTTDYYPVCEGGQVEKIKNGRRRELILNISCERIWIPGKYILIIRDDLDCLSVMRIDFSLDERLVVALESQKSLGPISFENTLASCFQCDNANWTGVSHTPGAAQMRHRAILSTQMSLFNEYRKEDGNGELRFCKNLLVAMNNPTVDFLGRLAMLIDSDYGYKFIDCASLYDLSCNNPYEPLQEKFDDTNMKLLCLTRIQELSAPTGKVALRKIIDKVRLSGDHTLIWLCGTRREIETLLNVAPSLKQFLFRPSLLGWWKRTLNSVYRQKTISHVPSSKVVRKVPSPVGHPSRSGSSLRKRLSHVISDVSSCLRRMAFRHCLRKRTSLSTNSPMPPLLTSRVSASSMRWWDLKG